jgi:hypothetical protein
MDPLLFEKLHAEGLISEAALQQVETREANRLFSLHRELRLLLYLGVLLLTGGLGVLVYKNIDTIGHQAVLAFIGLVTIGCFYYALRKKAPFSWQKVEAADGAVDYILLLGCLSLLTFLAYLQFEYDVFGDNYGLATFIPMVILFAAAYYFDHLGVLSLAITNLAAWAGLTITPLSLLHTGNFASDRLILTGVLLGILLLLAGRLSTFRSLKAHFASTYYNFGLHLFFVAALAGLFTYDRIYLLWCAGLLVLAGLFFIAARRMRSFYYVLCIVLYAYIGLSYAALRLMWTTTADISFMLGLLYLGLSASGVATLLIRLNRQFRHHDSL